MPVSVSSAGISLTLSPYGHSPYHIYDEQRERSPDFCHLHFQYFPTPPSLRDTSPIFCIAKHPAMLRGTAREVENSSGLLHSRYFNRQKRNKKERVHRNDVPSLYRAEDEAQTRDPQLGRLMLYQLSYFRNFFVGKDGFEPPKA